MKTENDKNKPKTASTHYGKKLYVLNPAIARLKPPADDNRQLRFEDFDEKERMD